jgi:hypothetical protein
MNAAAQNSRQRPVVLVPEVAIPSDIEACQREAPRPDASGRLVRRACFWSVGVAGAFRGNSRRLGDLASDCFTRLGTLRNSSGSLYLPPSPAPIRRLFLAGHSGGGQALSACAVSDLARAVPTDMWLYDCTYGSTTDYEDLVQRWYRAGRLGNGPSASRMVVIVTPDPRTTGMAAALINRLEQAFHVRRARLGRSGYQPGTLILEIDRYAGLPQIDLAMRSYPVVFMHYAGVQDHVGNNVHDEIPRVWTPRLLASATTP